MFDWICICQTKKTCCLTIFSFLDKNHLEWVWVVIRAVSKPGFLWNQINHGSHNIFWLFRSKALQKVKKIKNPCRFRVSNLRWVFWKNPLVKWGDHTKTDILSPTLLLSYQTRQILLCVISKPTDCCIKTDIIYSSNLWKHCAVPKPTVGNF